MPSPRRRTKVRADWLTDSERFFLISGYVTGDSFGVAFSTLGDGETWITDVATARLAWEAHRDELIDAMPLGLIPWAAIRFDGAAGRSSFYDHLRGRS